MESKNFAPDKNHYAGLDALRGIAALAVVGYHFGSRDDLPYLFPRGYLAVDFFFVLSGFVIAAAYSKRLADGNLTVPRFFLIRGIRLLPLIVIGALLAAAIEIFRPGISDQGRHVMDTATAVGFGILLVPILWQTTLEYAIFPLNGPTWSLFFEVVANALFAPFPRFRIGFLAGPILVVSAACLLWCAYSLGTINVGPLPKNFWFGFGRVGWSFTLGLLLFRWRHHAPRVPFELSLVILVAIFLVPTLPFGNGYFDCICVLAIMPVLVFAASRSQFDAFGRKLSAISADLSYPIYALHYPMVRALALTERKLQLSLLPHIAFVLVGATVVILVCWGAYVFFDAPIRRVLTNATRKKSTLVLAE
jgi:peptidoglycan/LPS O-acetylase OafA/YrhL